MTLATQTQSTASWWSGRLGRRLNARLAALPWMILAIAMGVDRVAHADTETYQKLAASTGWVLTKGAEGTSSGTGVLVDQDRRRVITNAHVVGDRRTAVVFFQDHPAGHPVVEKSHYLENVKKLGLRGRVVAVDRKRDLAIIELDRLPGGATAIELATESTAPGVAVHSIGNPGSSEALWVYTSGTVRSVYQKKFRTLTGEHDFRVVETQSPINTGDSGGPVADASGKLVGIAQAMSHRASLVSYCVDVSEVRDFLASPWKAAPTATPELLELAGIDFRRHDSGHYQIEMETEKGHKQTLFVASEIEYFEKADVRKVWSLATTLTETPTHELTLRLLRENAVTKIGSWTIQKDASDQYRVLFVIKLDATSPPETLRSSLQYAAKITRQMMQELEPSPEPKTAAEVLSEWLTD